MKIEQAHITDAAQILSLQKLAYQSVAELAGDFMIEPLMQTIEDVEKAFENHFILKCIADERIVGSVRAIYNNGTCHIAKLMTHPEYQNKGIGTQLMKEI